MSMYLILNSKQDEEENREISNELTAKEIFNTEMRNGQSKEGICFYQSLLLLSLFPVH